MSCPHCKGLESMFNQRAARRALRRYRSRGPEKTTRALVDAIGSESVPGSTVLDIGGGVGAVSYALFDAGATAAMSVDASAAYIDAAREEAERRGHAERMCFRHGDFVALAAEVVSADIVTLDRVICCYPDVRALVGLSAARARRAYGLVFPRDTWWTRLAMGTVNLVLFLARNPMRTFVHPTGLVDDLLERAGFARRFHRLYIFWQVVVWSRVGESS